MYRDVTRSGGCRQTLTPRLTPRQEWEHGSVETVGRANARTRFVGVSDAGCISRADRGRRVLQIARWHDPQLECGGGAAIRIPPGRGDRSSGDAALPGGPAGRGRTHPARAGAGPAGARPRDGARTARRPARLPLAPRGAGPHTERLLMPGGNLSIRWLNVPLPVDGRIAAVASIAAEPSGKAIGGGEASVAAAILAAESAERGRLADALHDDTVQVLTAALYAVDRARRDSPQPQLADASP